MIGERFNAGPRPRREALLVLLMVGVLSAHGADNGTDWQATFTAASVGRLWVPATRYESGYARHYEEQCSGTLVAPDGQGASRLVVSAWHCFEDYRDLSRPLVYESAAGQRQEARLLVSGGAMGRDWALLRLAQALPGASAMATGREALQPGAPILMAGYPRRSNSMETKQLIRTQCAITAPRGDDMESDCVLRVGASGGGVFTAEDHPRFLGVISRGDGQRVSVFVPLQRFLRQINPYR